METGWRQEWQKISNYPVMMARGTACAELNVEGIPDARRLPAAEDREMNP